MDTAKENAELRMKTWKSLPQPRLNWEAFKRMVGQFGLEKAKVLAVKKMKR
jgi:hypothetical protein